MQLWMIKTIIFCNKTT